MSSLSPPNPAAVDSVRRLALAPKIASDLSAMERHGLILAVVGAHVACAWALLQVDAVRRAVADVVPMQVDFIAPPLPTTPPPPPAAAPRPPSPRPVVRDLPIAATPSPAPLSETELVPVHPPSPGIAPAPAVAITAATASPAAPAPPSPPAAPRLVPVSAVQYLVLPPVEVPRASRRAGEWGTVMLRVRVDTRGAPVTVALHASSGFERLDEQALWAMQQARFKPYAVDGVPVEWQVIAPIEYPK